MKTQKKHVPDYLRQLLFYRFRIKNYSCIEEILEPMDIPLDWCTYDMSDTIILTVNHSTKILFEKSYEVKYNALKNYLIDNGFQFFDAVREKIDKDTLFDDGSAPEKAFFITNMSEKEAQYATVKFKLDSYVIMYMDPDLRIHVVSATEEYRGLYFCFNDN